jgi:hypothetical protein
MGEYFLMSSLCVVIVKGKSLCKGELNDIVSLKRNEIEDK